jgi:threonine aldolase
MRQAGILAAAGIVALESMVDRLVEDHVRAGLLGAGLKEIPGILVDPGSPSSNMIYLNLDQDIVPMDAAQTASLLDESGVKVGVTSQDRMRLVTHYWIGDEDIDIALNAFRKVL